MADFQFCNTRGKQFEITRLSKCSCALEAVFLKILGKSAVSFVNTLFLCLFVHFKRYYNSLDFIITIIQLSSKLSKIKGSNLVTGQKSHNQTLEATGLFRVPDIQLFKDIHLFLTWRKVCKSLCVSARFTHWEMLSGFLLVLEVRQNDPIIPSDIWLST